MGILIDRDTYDKTKKCQPGQGYWLRNTTGFSRPQPNRIVLHTTNGVKGSSFNGEADYLWRSKDVAAHYLIGHSGQIARLLTPAAHIAWAVGNAIPGWGNYETINIECHWDIYSGNEWPDPMLDSLTLLVLEIATVYVIGDFRTEIETHRHIALPPGRKVDPSGFDDRHFHTWREMVQCRREKV